MTRSRIDRKSEKVFNKIFSITFSGNYACVIVRGFFNPHPFLALRAQSEVRSEKRKLGSKTEKGENKIRVGALIMV